MKNRSGLLKILMAVFVLLVIICVISPAGYSLYRFCKKTRCFNIRLRNIYAVGYPQKSTKSTKYGDSYYFDDNIQDAIHHSMGKMSVVDSTKKAINLGFEFDNHDPNPLILSNDTYRHEQGSVRFVLSQTNYLYTRDDLNCRWQDIFEVEIKIKVSKARKLLILWSSDAHKRLPYEKLYSVFWREDYESIDLIADNEFHIYKLNFEKIIASQDSIIRRLFVLIDTLQAGEVEIDYIRFNSKHAAYSRIPYGVSDLVVDNEMRHVMYLRTGSILTYELKVPDGETWLGFGNAILEDGRAVNFRIVVEESGQANAIYDYSLSSNAKWQDAELNLSAWKGKQVKISFIAEGEEPAVAFWSNPVLYTEPKERMNVVIILEDSLRADHLSCYGYKRETTPVKDLWSKKGVLFLNAFAQSCHTRPSCMSLMTSLYASSHGTWYFTDSLDDRFTTLAEILRDRGSATASFSQTRLVSFNSGLCQGFSFNKRYKDGNTADLNEVYDSVIEWIKRYKNRNLFLYVHIKDPHCPYSPPPPFDSKFLDNGEKQTPVPWSQYLDTQAISMPTMEERISRYDGEIYKNDHFFKKLIDALQDLQMTDDTLVIFSADHGEYLGEYGLWEHPGPGRMQVLHVPVIMVYPKKLPKDKVIKEKIQLIDIVPTILELAGMDETNFALQGDSLVSLIHNRDMRYWKTRFCYSEEVFHSKPIQTGKSLFLGWYHILKSILCEEKTLFCKIDTNRNYIYSSHMTLPRLMLKLYSDIIISKIYNDNRTIYNTVTKRQQDPVVSENININDLKSLGYMQ